MAKAKSTNNKTIKASTAIKKAKVGESTSSPITALPTWENGVTKLNAANMEKINAAIKYNATNIATKADQSTTYTKTETDTLLSAKADKPQFFTIEDSSESNPAELAVNNIYYYTGSELYINLSSANLVNLGDKITLVINNFNSAAGYLYVSSTTTPLSLDIRAGRLNEFIFTCIEKDNNECRWMYSENAYEYTIDTN